MEDQKTLYKGLRTPEEGSVSRDRLDSDFGPKRKGGSVTEFHTAKRRRRDTGVNIGRPVHRGRQRLLYVSTPRPGKNTGESGPIEKGTTLDGGFTKNLRRTSLWASPTLGPLPTHHDLSPE